MAVYAPNQEREAAAEIALTGRDPIATTPGTNRSRIRARLLHAYDLLYELVMRDVKIRYKRSVLGFAWSLMLPLSQLVIFTLLFHHMLAQRIEHYPVYVFIGVLTWNWFQASVLSSVGAITDNRDLVRQPNVPLAVLPAARVVTDLIHFLFALPLLLLFVACSHCPMGWPVLAIPLVIVIEGVLALAVSYFAAALNVTFRDTRHLLSVLLMLWFYLTPVFWVITLAPARYRPIAELNPMYRILDAYRLILLHNQSPNFTILGALALIFGSLLIAGYYYFRAESHRFIEEV